MNESITTSPPRLGHSTVRANMADAGAALTIAGFLFIVLQFIAPHAALVRDMHVQVRIVGANSVVALLFNDRYAAEGTLAVLEASSPLHVAGIFSVLRKPSALYQHGDAAQVRAPDIAMLRESDVSTLTTLGVVEPVESERRVIGYVVMRSSLGKLYMQLPGYAVLTISVGIGAMGLAYLVIVRMHRIVLQVEAHLDYFAHIDSVTELPNRYASDERLRVSLKRAGQADVVGLLLLNLDNFKVASDTLGYNSGDHPLRQVARRLNDVIEQVSPRAVLYRIGGDESAVIVELSGRAQIAATEAATLADGLVKHILAALAAPFAFDLHQTYVTAGVGVSLYPHDACNVQALTCNTDTATYHAKNHGKNASASFTSEMGQQARRHLRVEVDLRCVLDCDEPLLVYQSQVRLRTEGAHDAVVFKASVYSVEALVRWRHPGIGLIGPGELIAVAEETGLIVPLGLWVLRIACQQAVRWMREEDITLRAAVDLSVWQTRDPVLVENAMDMLHEIDLPPYQLELEIIESVLTGDIEANIALLESLHATGISLSVDDFGTGYSSLVYPQHFPIQKPKIDRSLVQRVSDDDEAIAGVATAMAHSLRMQVVAESVEDPEQLALLRDTSCDLGQGYPFSRPQQADALLVWLNRLGSAEDEGSAAFADDEAAPSTSLPLSSVG